MAVLRQAGKLAAEAVPVAQVARLGLPALIAVAVLAVLVLAAMCWVIGSDERCDRVARVLGVWRGAPASVAPAPEPPRARPRMWGWGRWQAARRSHKQASELGGLVSLQPPAVWNVSWNE